MENNKALSVVVTNLQIVESPDQNSDEEQFEILVEFIDGLVRKNFNRLLRILYRIDISEEKLQRTLAENKYQKISSAELIAKLLIEREEEKIISREKYSRK